MSKVLQRFERQTDLQKARQTLPWPEKVRMAEKIRESIKQLRAAPSRKGAAPPHILSEQQPPFPFS